MKNLFICNTYMQFLAAIQIVINYCDNDINDLILTDYSINMDRVAERLKKESFFSKVYYLEIKRDIEMNSKKIYFGYWKSILLGTKAMEKYLFSKGMEMYDYDQIFAYNKRLFFYGMYFLSCKKYGIPKLNIIEEGILSYKAMTFPSSQRNIKTLLFWKKMISGKDGHVDKYYCFYPESIEERKDIVKIPSFTKNKDFVDFLIRIFDYKKIYFPRHIYFTGSADIDGYIIHEDEIVKSVADKVGWDNLLIKKHPRDNSDKYEKTGLNVYRDSFVPWEVISLIEDFTGCVFYTICSTSVIHAAVMTGEKIICYYLYPMILGRCKRYECEILKNIEIEKMIQFCNHSGCEAELIVADQISQL